MESVTVRYWAAARAASGVREETVPVPGPVTLQDLVATIVGAHPESPALAGVLSVCSVMVDGRQLRTVSPAEQAVRPGQSVEFLPPFAGG